MVNLIDAFENKITTKPLRTKRVSQDHIIDKKGVVYARGEFNNVYTFAGEKARFSALWKERLTQGKYDLVFTIDIGKALEEVELGKGPIITKEATLEIDGEGGIAAIGELK